MERSSPLVTVFIPTFERPEQLVRAVESVLDQDYGRVEIVISDNASGDETQSLGEKYSADRPSITYRRHPRNIGPTANFESLRPLGDGDYFMFLGDDDWLDAGYVSACTRWLEDHPDAALVAGRTSCHRDGRVEPEPFPITVDAPSPRARLLDYYRAVRGNGVFYGIIPARLNGRVPELRNVQGGDMLYVAALAYLGSVKTLDGVAVHRTMGGTSANLATVAATLGLGWFEAYAPQVAIAYWVFRDIAFDSPLFAELGRVGRFTLGLHAGAIVFVRFVPGAVVKFGRLVLARAASGLRGGRSSMTRNNLSSAQADAGISR
jgi:glycosyltransferase involved in cell wall biosynthesis